MAAIELPAALPLAPTPPDALFLHHTLQQRFRVEVRLSRPRFSLSTAAGERERGGKTAMYLAGAGVLPGGQAVGAHQRAVVQQPGGLPRAGGSSACTHPGGCVQELREHE